MMDSKVRDVRNAPIHSLTADAYGVYGDDALTIARRVERIKAELKTLEARQIELHTQLVHLESLPRQPSLRFRPARGSPNPQDSLDRHSPQEAKIALFRSLFRGRDDVFPKRFVSMRTGKSGYQPCCRHEWLRGLCDKPRIKCVVCPNRSLVPVTDDVIRNHLLGADPNDRRRQEFIIGVYPLLEDETCWFVAADFDKSSFAADVSAFRETCREMGVPLSVERSRSGNGAHAWIFFGGQVPAAMIRKLATFIITQTMIRRPELGLDSYDRLFPNQDTMPKGGFGNLIALPLQKKPRESGNSVFVDEEFIPYPDQWAYLSSVRRLSREETHSLIGGIPTAELALGLDAGLTEADTRRPWLRLPSGNVAEPVYKGPKPERAIVVLGNQVYIRKEGFPPPLLNQLIRLAAFPNPEFFEAQSLRLPVFNIPRVIGCHEQLPEHIGLPRGLRGRVMELLSHWGIAVDLQDERVAGVPIKANFNGELRSAQRVATKALDEHDVGVLAASTAFGKTVVAARMIAKRKVNTLILVHSRQLLDQWLARLKTFLDLPPNSIGQIRGGKNKPTGVIDVATLQSLIHKGVVDDRVARYGHVVFDECHHVSASSFEQVARQCKAKFVLGLSATVRRKDGHHPIIFMQCGAVRYEVTDKEAAMSRPFEHVVIPRATNFSMPPVEEKPTAYQVHQIFQAIAQNEERNKLVVNDIVEAVSQGRNPVVLTERIEHLGTLSAMLTARLAHVCVVRGGMGVKERKRLMEEYRALPTGAPKVLMSTGRFLGEGFDEERLDTLFLVFPISWRGTLAQYAGRLHRLSERKERVIIYDYADLRDPVLVSMFRKRCAGYRSIGYVVQESEWRAGRLEGLSAPSPS